MSRRRLVKLPISDEAALGIVVSQDQLLVPLVSARTITIRFGATSARYRNMKKSFPPLKGGGRFISGSLMARRDPYQKMSFQLLQAAHSFRLLGPRFQ